MHTREEIMRLPRHKPIEIDSTGVGDPIVEDLQRHFQAMHGFKFALEGEARNQYEILGKRPAAEVEYFSEVKNLTELESNVINMIGKDKRALPRCIL